MRTSKYSEEQIIGFLKQVEAGMPVKDVCRKGGFSRAAFCKWRAKYGGMDVPDARPLNRCCQWASPSRNSLDSIVRMPNAPGSSNRHGIDCFHGIGCRHSSHSWFDQ